MLCLISYEIDADGRESMPLDDLSSRLQSPRAEQAVRVSVSSSELVEAAPPHNKQ